MGDRQICRVAVHRPRGAIIFLCRPRFTYALHLINATLHAAITRVGGDRVPFFLRDHPHPRALALEMPSRLQWYNLLSKPRTF